MNIQNNESLNVAFNLIKSCSLDQASDILKKEYIANLEKEDLVYALKLCNFWKERLNSLSNLNDFEKGEFLIHQWSKFSPSTSEDTQLSKELIYAFKKGIFTKALECFSNVDDEKDQKLYAELCRKKGYCYKALGSYEEALKLLTESNSYFCGRADITAEMADCYALCGESKNAKILFREAFYMDPSKIDISLLDCDLIHILSSKVEEKGFTGNTLLQWIPVYGVILGIFNVKRTLKSQELLQLKQEIYSKECELKDSTCNKTVTTPRLLNLYFRLLDHYIQTKEDIKKVNEVMLKIKVLDPVIFKQYRL